MALARGQTLPFSLQTVDGHYNSCTTVNRDVYLVYVGEFGRNSQLVGMIGSTKWDTDNESIQVYLVI